MITKGLRIMAFGTFDIFHEGHRSYLAQAKELGKYLIVVVARDETVLRVKSEWTKNSEEERLEVVEKSGLADEVVLGSLENKYTVIEKYQPAVIALGYDQRLDLSELTEKLKNLKLKAEIVRLKSFQPEKYKSSKLKNRL
jgi:cytidyltransferase-like protein